MNSEKIVVFARLRPIHERDSSSRWRISKDMKSLSLEKGKEYSVDRIFPGETTNEEIYAQISSSIDFVLRGTNSSILAYGQTGSGKTYTILGLLSSAFQEIMRKISKDGTRDYVIKVSYIEVYNEIVHDLLFSYNARDMESIRERPTLKICDHPIRGVVINGVTEIEIKEVKDFMILLQSGEKKRHYGKTQMNDNSSRSHTIYMLQVESRQRVFESFHTSQELDDNIIEDEEEEEEEEEEEDQIERMMNRKLISSLSLVDLAGSEKQKRSNTSGIRFKEGCYINKSLLALGVVISKLSENPTNTTTTTSTRIFASHIPYRDSKLTRILKPALGNNSLCSIICCIDPRDSSIEESVSTLKFACRASKVRSKVKVNEVFDFETPREKKYFRKIQKLQRIIKRKNEIIVEQQTLQPLPLPQRKESFVVPKFREEEEEEEEEEKLRNNNIIKTSQHDQQQQQQQSQEEFNFSNNNYIERERFDKEIEKFQELAEEKGRDILEKRELKKKVSLLEGEKIVLEVQKKMIEEEKESYRSKFEKERKKREDLFQQLQQRRLEHNYNYVQKSGNVVNNIGGSNNNDQNNSENQRVQFEVEEEEEEEDMISGVKRKRNEGEDRSNFENEYSRYTVPKKRKIV